jgi:hypothetical protein
MKKNRYIARSDDEGCCIKSEDEVVEPKDDWLTESEDSDSEDENNTE